MRKNFAELSFDFDKKYLSEKTIFLETIAKLNFIATDSLNNWKIEIDEEEKKAISTIKKKLLKAKEFSKIENVQYIVITDHFLYFDILI